MQFQEAVVYYKYTAIPYIGIFETSNNDLTIFQYTEMK